MVKRIFIAVLLILFCSEGVSSVTYADNAEVLPKGRFSVSVESEFYIPYEHRFNPDGDVEDIATDFNATLNNDLIDGLDTLGGIFGLAPGVANVGESIVDFELQYSVVHHLFQYGLTDKLTVGVHVPYWRARNKVKAFVDSSAANMGKSALAQTNLGIPFVSMAADPFGDAERLNTEDIQDFLGGGMDINGDGIIDVAGLGYKRFKSWSDEGIGDIEAGFRYQYLKTKNWRLATTIAARFPTGEIDDPDNLVDFRAWGSGTYSMLFYFHNDFTGIKNHVFDATFKYDLILPQTEEWRVLNNVNQPLSSNRERVDIDIGDIMEINVSDNYTVLKGFNASLLYSYRFKLKDRVSGDMGFVYEALEQESRLKEHNINIGLSYSTIPLFIEKKFPIPMNGDIAYRYRFAGSDNAVKSQYISFGLSVFF